MGIFLFKVIGTTGQGRAGVDRIGEERIRFKTQALHDLNSN